VEAAVKGGSVYAAGGGGWADHGRMLGLAAVNRRQAGTGVDRRADDEDWIATAAAIGAPASTTPWEMQGIDYVKAVQLLQEALGEKVSALIIGQNGKSSTLNGWLPSAILGTKVVDAVGDIRAHPTGDMGSIGMAGSPEPMIQTAVGGNRDENRYIELVVKGATAKISPVLRAAADNPAASSPAAAIRCAPPMCAAMQHSAASRWRLRSARRSSRRRGKGGSDVIDAICKTTNGHILAEGVITRKDVVYTKEAFDIGTITLGQGRKIGDLHVMNEYMAVDDADGGRLATFPAVITTLSPEGEPLSVGQLKEGMHVFILHVPKDTHSAVGKRARSDRLSRRRKGDGDRDRPLCTGGEGLSHGARSRSRRTDARGTRRSAGLAEKSMFGGLPSC
jgi:DUF917 family protein